MEILYIPVGVPTFDLEYAKKQFNKSIELLKTLDCGIIVPEEILLGVGSLAQYVLDKKPSLAIVQNVTFANGAYMTEVLRRLDCPVLLWTLRDPVTNGGRLKLNSLTGAFSAANVLRAFGRPFEYVLGDPDEEEVKRAIAATLKAVRLIDSVRRLNILQIGHTPQGFGFGRALDMEIATTFGANLISVEARELIAMAKGYTDAEVEPYLESARGSIRGLERLPQNNVKDFARLYKAYAEYAATNNIGALSTRCWPDFFVDFGTPVCAVLALMNDRGVASACEADTYGALSMYMAQQLTSVPAFFGDPVAVNERANTLTFWHCGTGACSLARKDEGACAGVHCNRKIGPTLEFGVKACERVTVFRIGKDAEGKFRFFIATGSAPDVPQQYYGTSMVVKTDENVTCLVKNAVKAGWEPHFAVAMGDISRELKTVADMLGIEVF